MKNISKSDWDRVNKMSDSDIDLSDIPETTDDFWENADLYLPPKQDSLIQVLKRYHLNSNDIEIVIKLIKRLAH